MIWRSSYHGKVVQLIDFFSVILGFICAYFLWEVFYVLHIYYFHRPFSPKLIHFYQMLFSALIFVSVMNNYKSYSFQRFTSLSMEYINVLKSSSFTFLIIIITSFMIGEREIPRTILVLSFITILVLSIIQKSILFFIASKLRVRGYNRKKIIITGDGTRTNNFVNILKENVGWGLDLQGILTMDGTNESNDVEDVKVLGKIDNLEKILVDYNPDEIIITLSTKEFHIIRKIIEICEREGVAVRLNSDFMGHLVKNIYYDRIYGLNLISFIFTYEDGVLSLIKRIMDIIGAIAALIIFSPLMIIAFVGILLTDGRPILYDWRVIGKNKKPFNSWKFRTMVRNADNLKENLFSHNEMFGPVFKIKDDPRILPFGKWLRKWSIDETPQLFSVLKGDMSLVGPRPAGPHELLKYESWHRRKLSIKPGITCLWQANGRNEIKNFDDWVKLDLEYIDNWSLLLDVKILFKTVYSVILRRGAC